MLILLLIMKWNSLRECNQRGIVTFIFKSLPTAIQPTIVQNVAELEANQKLFQNQLSKIRSKTSGDCCERGI